MSKKLVFDYFNFFREMMDCGIESANYLKKVISKYNPDKIEEYKTKIHEFEHLADLKKHKMMQSLLKEFLPPIDREDIVRISHVLDEICDNIEEIIILLYVNDIKSCRVEARTLCDIILTQCLELKKLFENLHNFKKDKDSLEKCIIAVNTIEEEGDRLYINCMRSLNREDIDFKTFFAWRDIYNGFENCCDSCEKTADAVEEVLMKLS